MPRSNSLKRRYSSSKSDSRSHSNSRRKHRSSKYNSKKYRTRKDSQSRSFSPKNKGNILYITNLSSRVKERHLRAKFEKFGEIEDVNLVTDPYSGDSRGFAFIYYYHARDADDALDELNNSEMEGRYIRVEKAKRAKPREKTPGKYMGHNKAKYRRSPSYHRDRHRRRFSRSRSNNRRGRSRSFSHSRSKSKNRRYRKKYSRERSYSK